MSVASSKLKWTAQLTVAVAVLCLPAPLVPDQAAAPGTQSPSGDSEYAPLWLYQGDWLVAKRDPGAAEVRSGLEAGEWPGLNAGRPDQLHNDCSRVGQFFACQQTVNGQVGSLIVFIPTDTPGHYYTQAVQRDGWASGRGELKIEGDLWTYLGKDEVKGKTTYYRTTNMFTGKDRIHYEQAESPDGQHWTVKASGDEKRGSS